MKKATRGEIMRYLANVKRDEPNATFTCRTEKNGIGDYDRDETYSKDGKPVFMLSVRYSHGKTLAFWL